MFFEKKPSAPNVAQEPKLTNPAQNSNDTKPIVPEKQGTAQTTPTSQFSDPNLTPPPAPISITKSLVVIQDPFCLFGKKDFLALPDFYLKPAYKSSVITIALPLAFAKCFVNNTSTIKVMFFLYNKGLMLPWKPLVKGEFVISETKEYLTEADFVTDTKQPLPKPDFFDRYKNQKFLKIVLKKLSLENYPPYHPLPPGIHAFATGLPDLEFQRKLTEQNVVLIDARGDKKKKSSPIKLSALNLIFKGDKIHEKVLDIQEIKAKKFGLIKKLPPQTTILIFGAGARDFSSYNVVNYLASYGYFNTYFLNSPSTVFQFKPAKDLAIGFPKISAEEAKLEKKSDAMLFVDLRKANISHGTIKGAYVVPFNKKSSGASEEKVKLEPNAEELKNLLYAQRKKISKVVLFGASDSDEKAIQTANAIKPSINISTYWLTDGFRAWSYNAKYKWDDTPRLRQPKRDKNRKRGQRNSPPPKRDLVKSAIGKKSIFIPNAVQDKGKPTSPSRIDKQIIKERRQEIIAKRRQSTKVRPEKAQ